MFCPSCGKKIEEVSNFCIYCGSDLGSVESLPINEIVRNVLIKRIEGIKNRNSETVQKLVHVDKYTKFDDWPPFDLQHKEGLESEFKAIKMLKNYNYETRTWNIEVFGDSAIAAFIIRYRGTMKDMTFDVQSRVTTFLIKHEGKWKIVHEHWSRFPSELKRQSTKSKPIVL